VCRCEPPRRERRAACDGIEQKPDRAGVGQFGTKGGRRPSAPGRLIGRKATEPAKAGAIVQRLRQTHAPTSRATSPASARETAPRVASQVHLWQMQRCPTEGAPTRSSHQRRHFIESQYSSGCGKPTTRHSCSICRRGTRPFRRDEICIRSEWTASAQATRAQVSSFPSSPRSAMIRDDLWDEYPSQSEQTAEVPTRTIALIRGSSLGLLPVERQPSRTRTW
jgi:hypothetical protein